MDLFDQIKQKLDEIKEITKASDRLEAVMKSPHTTTEDLDHAIKEGIKTLESIEDRRKSQ